MKDADIREFVQLKTYLRAGGGGKSYTHETYKLLRNQPLMLQVEFKKLGIRSEDIETEWRKIINEA